MRITHILYNTQVGFLDKMSVTSYWSYLQLFPVWGDNLPFLSVMICTLLILSIFCPVDVKFLIPTNCTYGNKYSLCHSQNITNVFWLYLVIYKEDLVTKEIVCCCRNIYMIVKYEAYVSAGNYNQIVQNLIKTDVWWCIYNSENQLKVVSK